MNSLRINVDPKIQAYVAAAVFVLMLLAKGNGGEPMLPPGIPIWFSTDFVAWVNWIVGLYVPISGYLGLSASTKSGPLSADALKESDKSSP